MRIQRDRAELERLQSDPYHVGGGNAAQNQEAALRARIRVAEGEAAEVQRLSRAEEKDPTATIETTMNDQLPAREMIAAVDDLRALGLNDKCISEALNGIRERPAIIAEAKERLAAQLSDAEWVRKLNAGDRATRKELTLLSVVVNATPTDE